MSRKLLLVSLLSLFFSVDASASTPKEYAEGIADSVINIIESPRAEDLKEKELISLFRKNVDTEWMAAFTMGKYYRTLSPAQKSKYNDLYRDYVIYSYIPKFRMYTGERMVVNQTLDEGGDFYTVKTVLKTKASSTGKVLVDYKLRKQGGSFKIVDIIGEGVSLINTQRSDFSAPLSSGVDAFIARLEEKVKNLKARPATALRKEKLSDAKPAAGNNKPKAEKSEETPAE